MELFLKFLRLLPNYKSSMLPICKPKSSFLILLWMFIAYDAVFFFHFSTDIIYRKILLAICVGGCVISGWLADVYIGRYRCIRYSSRIAWVGTIALNTYYMIQNYLWQPHHIADTITQIILNGIVSVGLVGLLANSVQLGLDQMVDASSTKIISYISWCVCMSFLAAVVASVFQTGFYKYFSISVSLISVSFLMTVLVISEMSFNHLIIKEPVTHNPLKLIFQVLRYAVKNKHPRLRSAFTYWEDKPYSRIDLGKAKYGGPFTTEQAEDVKTFFQILILSCASIILIGFVYGREGVIYHQLYHYQHKSYIEYSSNSLTYQFLQSYFELKIVWNFSYITVVILTVIFEFILYPIIDKYIYIRRISSFTRMQVSLAILVLCEIVHLCIETSAVYKTNNQNSTCLFYASYDNLKHNNVVQLDYKWLLIPQAILGLSLYLTTTSGAEFIIAQTPYSMRGLLIGCIFFLFAASVALFDLLYYYVISLLKEEIQYMKMCGIWYYVASTVFCIILFFFSLITRRLYSPRRRDDNLHNQQIFAINYYEKYLGLFTR